MHTLERTVGASEVLIACAFDEAWAPQFATCARTVAASRGAESVHFIVLGGPALGGRTASTVGAYVRDLGLSWELLTPSEKDLRSLPGAGIFSPLVWYRTLLPGLLPEHDRVLSLDVDTLVLQSLLPLFERDLGDNLLAAVSAAPGPDPHFRVSFAGLEPLKYCFNAGVMLLNLEAMRDAQTGPCAIALGHEKGEQLIFAEQDALNHLARHRWELLHPKWNGLSYLWMAPDFADDAYTERATRDCPRRTRGGSLRRGRHDQALVLPLQPSSATPLPRIPCADTMAARTARERHCIRSGSAQDAVQVAVRARPVKDGGGARLGRRVMRGLAGPLATGADILAR